MAFGEEEEMTHGYTWGSFSEFVAYMCPECAASYEGIDIDKEKCLICGHRKGVDKNAVPRKEREREEKRG